MIYYYIDDVVTVSSFYNFGFSSVLFLSWHQASLGHGCYCFALLRSIPTVVYIILVTALRYHLFIWSVFSPKMLYEAMHTLVATVVCIFFTALDQNHIAQS